MKLILVSTSKFKREILKKVKMNHKSIDSNFKELSSNKRDVRKYVKNLALGKVKSVEKNFENSIILGLDTICYVDGVIYEKPKSLEDAKNNLRVSSNKKVSIITGICMLNQTKNEIIEDVQITDITFNEISEADLNYYIENEPDVMHASGFIFETVASNFLNKIEGSYYNILGMPVEKVYEILKKWNIELKDLEK